MEFTGVLGRDPEGIDEEEPLDESEGGGDGGGERFDKEFAGVGGTIWKRPTDRDNTATIATRSRSSSVSCVSERPIISGSLVVVRPERVAEIAEADPSARPIAATGWITFRGWAGITRTTPPDRTTV